MSEPQAAETQGTRTGQTDQAGETNRAGRPEEPTAPEPSAVVAIPGSLRQETPRPSLWQRISLRGGRTGLSAATGDDRLLARLDAIETRVESSAHEVVERISRLEERFAEVWEVEEQISRLTELEQTLSEVRERQASIGDRLRGLGLRLSLLVFLAATAAVAALAGVALRFP